MSGPWTVCEISVEADGDDPRDTAEATQRLARDLLRARLNVQAARDFVPDGAKSGTAARWWPVACSRPQV